MKFRGCVNDKKAGRPPISVGPITPRYLGGYWKGEFRDLGITSVEQFSANAPSHGCR